MVASAKTLPRPGRGWANSQSDGCQRSGAICPGPTKRTETKANGMVSGLGAGGRGPDPSVKPV